MEYRIEQDTLGEVHVPSNALWGAQTQRSLAHFSIGEETMPEPLLHAYGIVKKAAAGANLSCHRLSEERALLIRQVCDEIVSGALSDSFPLSVWQTGSGTQTNMNLNEVIANRGNQLAGRPLLHPNDHVNLSQSSNDSFPSAMHIASANELTGRLFPALKEMISALLQLELRYPQLIKTGRTHLQDAVPIAFGQEVSAWRSMMEHTLSMLEATMPGLYALPLGGTAVGTGLNAPEGFADLSIAEISEITALPFYPSENLFHALSSKDALVFSHGALKALAANLLKVANDVRWLSSGPRCGLGEIFIPQNEPGSSIMPGKVNPTQCESVMMVSIQVIANDTAISLAASQGNFQLNTFMPACAYNFLQSVRLLSDSISSFTRYCLSGIQPNEDKMAENLDRSLMNVTALTPHIGYENGAKVAKLAYRENISLREAVLRLALLTEDEFDRLFQPKKMV